MGRKDKKPSFIDGTTRRLMMKMWCRFKMGEDSWTDITTEYITFGVLVLLACLLCGCAPAHGDVLLTWTDVDTVVSPQNSGFTVEIGPDLAGTGRPLGWLTFMSMREGGGLTQIAAGSYSDRYGTEYGVQTLQIQAIRKGSWDMADLAAYHTPIGNGEFLTDFVRIWDESTVLPSVGNTYVLLNWSSYMNLKDDGSYGQMYSGKGWISLQDIVTEPSVDGMNDHPSYMVGRIALGTDIGFAGEMPVVPEPSTWCAVAVACGLVLYRRWRWK
jgi:hypothetical protein